MTAAGRGAPPPAWLDREEALVRAASERLDVVVVGAGITGAGVALDAAVRGYRVALLDRDDVAAGTSSRSSKLVHGGLRYLAEGDVPMVVEGVRERDRTRRMAPHLVRPLAFDVATPTSGDRALLKAGLSVYDALAAGRGTSRHVRLDGAALRASTPTLRAARHGGYRYWDARTDDARLTLAVVQAARARGALVATHVAVDRVTVGPSGRVDGVEVTDARTGRTARLRTRWVVAAGGVWAGAVRDLAPDGVWRPRIRPARGAHLVFPRASLPVTHAVVFRAGDGRRLIAVPWGEQVYVGTTDVPADDTAVTVTRDDVDYLLDALASAFRDAPGRRDVVAAWAGLRPLVGDGEVTADISRRHVVAEDPAGLVHVTGGKLTTWRAMAEDVLDSVDTADGRRARCRTASVPLGARDGGASRRRALAATRARGLDDRAGTSLWHRHGDLTPDVVASCAVEEDGLAPLAGGVPYLRGEVRWAVRVELARTAGDVLARRTRVALRTADGGLGEPLAHTLAVLDEELGGIDRAAYEAAYRAELASLRGVVAPGPAPVGDDEPGGRVVRR